MNPEYYVKLSDLIRDLHFQVSFMPCDPKKIKIKTRDVNRLGLEIIGSLDNFISERVIIMGESENYFFSTLTSSEVYKSVQAILSQRPPALILTHGIQPSKEMVAVAEKYSIPLLISKEQVPDVISDLSAFFNVYLAPRISRPGGLLTIHGEGVMITGESGVGKSETAIELLKRGHKLISDDLVEIRKIPKNTLIGSAPDNLKHFIEVRGIGIINARRIFGIGAIKMTETIDMVINLEHWDDKKNYERFGVETKYTEILGVQVPYVSIPIRPGRNVAVIIEVAAMNNRQRKLGYNAARELLINLGIDQPKTPAQKTEKCIWDM